MALHKKRILRLLRTLFIFFVLVGLIYGLGWSKLISVKNISITGTEQSNVLVNSLQSSHVELRQGMPLARVDVRAIDRIATQSGWIKSAEISRNWLHGLVSIRVTERLPVATYLDADGSTKYFDANGTIFTTPAPIAGLPTISFTRADSQLRIVAANWVSAMPADLLNGMQNLWVNSAERIVMKASLTSPVQKVVVINWGGVSDMPLKVKVLRALLLRPENEKHSNFDLSNPLAPITR